MLLAAIFTATCVKFTCNRPAIDAQICLDISKNFSPEDNVEHNYLNKFVIHNFLSKPEVI
ncbi:hypothetical protein DXX94_15540 [Thalassotalea euphylliae]|uniref:Uncharacterized protein n=1 Tax=Thalassotalea euphylliae TaxID=1655234 RepID=A0A3E0U630_9GAMM|nr:hypothetical protein DXX94_15540 [Thalassotalea euphylliae]